MGRLRYTPGTRRTPRLHTQGGDEGRHLEEGDDAPLMVPTIPQGHRWPPPAKWAVLRVYFLGVAHLLQQNGGHAGRQASRPASGTRALGDQAAGHPHGDDEAHSRVAEQVPQVGLGDEVGPGDAHGDGDEDDAHDDGVIEQNGAHG